MRGTTADMDDTAHFFLNGSLAAQLTQLQSDVLGRAKPAVSLVIARLPID